VKGGDVRGGEESRVEGLDGMGGGSAEGTCFDGGMKITDSACVTR